MRLVNAAIELHERRRRWNAKAGVPTLWGFAAAAVLLTLSACGGGNSDMTVTPEPLPTFTLTSSAFQDSQLIPTQFTCSGPGVSPPLAWSGAPKTTSAYALVVRDPDAPGGDFIHWVAVNIPSSARDLKEQVPVGRQLADGVVQARNGFGAYGYGGPCPPPGSAHHYHFDLYALAAPIAQAQSLETSALLQAIEQHAIAKAELVGLFGR